MKKTFDVVAYVLALNFLLVACGVGHLYRTGHLDRAKALAVKAALYPPPPPPTTQPAPADTTIQPTLQLDDLLKRAAGKSAEEQVQFIQQTFDAQRAQLDRRQRELADQQRQVDFGRQRLADDRAAVEAGKKQLADREKEATKLAGDEGFQNSLQLYGSMPPKQVKAIFMTLKDDIVVQYLQALPPRAAGKVIKEFKAPEELDRIQRILELMRQPKLTGKPVHKTPTIPASADGAAGGDVAAAADGAISGEVATPPAGSPATDQPAAPARSGGQ